MRTSTEPHFHKAFVVFVTSGALLWGFSIANTIINENSGSVAPSHSPWNYEDFSRWGDLYQVCNSGKRQSPIGIVTSTVLYDATLDHISFINYSGGFKGIFLNNGHTIQFNFDPAISNALRPKISDGGLANSYILEQFHFHWGNSSKGKATCMGAEHVIDGRSAPLEIHFVHFNSKYPTLADALNYPDGLAVVGFLFEPVTDAKLVKQDYAQVLDNIPHIIDADNKTKIMVDLSTIIPFEARTKDSAVFYRYDGSLTTPPCAEIVTWTVFDYRIPILVSTLDELREVMTDEVSHDPNYQGSRPHPLMVNNYRPPQPLGGRTVTCNKPIAIENSKRTLLTSHALYDSIDHNDSCIMKGQLFAIVAALAMHLLIHC